MDTFNRSFSNSSHEEFNIFNFLVKPLECCPSLLGNVSRSVSPGDSCIGAETAVVSPAVDGVVPSSLDVPDHQILFRLVPVIGSGQVEEGDVDGEEVIERLRALQGQSLEDGAHAEVWIGCVPSRVVEDEAEEVEVEEVAVERVVEVEKAVEESVAVSVSCRGDLVEDGRVQVRVVGGGVGAGW